MSRRHNPLAEDLSPTVKPPVHSATSTNRKRKSRTFEETGDGYIDALSSRKILTIAKDLDEADAVEGGRSAVPVVPNAAFGFNSRSAAAISADEQNILEGDGADDVDADWMPDEDLVEEDVDPSDLSVYRRFLPQPVHMQNFVPSLAVLSTTDSKEVQEGLDARNPVQNPTIASNEQSTNLADLILQRIAEKEATDQGKSKLQDNIINKDRDTSSDIPPRVVEVYTKCGQILSRYKSGPLPKPVKILPTLPSWTELLAITSPESWTANAVFAATKIFISATPEAAQHYVSTVLLDRVKEDIYETKKLNVHLYDALKKALYKPAAFFKGLLFPLIVEGCTLREANIISSVLVRVSIPVLHSAAALLHLCEIAAELSTNVNNESTGACNIFIRVLLEKKYALPYKAIDALVFHFLRFRNSKPAATGGDIAMSGVKMRSRQAMEDDKLPVLWHQSLLVFAQRYKNDITEDQRESLLDLINLRGHKDIGPEVRRELVAGRGRGVLQEPEAEGRVYEDGDDTMRDFGVGI
jgi:essential nuclear protein 1